MAGAIHQIHDTDVRFIVDPISRAVKNETLKKVSLVIDDHNSEIFTFELPRYIEGHDMANCNKVEVHYVNTHNVTKERSASCYKATDFGVDPSDPENKVIFSWTISEIATKYPGSLAFALHFACMDELTEDVHYWWSTAINSTITVLDSINLTEETEEETDLQEKTATPTKDTQVVRPDGDFRGLSRVVIEPIPADYIIPTGTLFVDANGEYEVREFDKILVSVPDIPAVLQEKEITANGTHTPDAGYEGFSQVTVNVADIPAVLQEKTVYPSTLEQTVVPDAGYDGLSKVTAGPMKLQSKSVTQNGEVIADDGFHGLDKVTVAVEPELQSKSLDLTANGETEIIADSGYYGLERVSVRVNVDQTPELQEKTATENGEVTPDEGFDGLSKVTVSVAGSAVPTTVSTEAEMTALLESGEVGGVYMYVGETTETYENGALYVLEEEAVATITFTIDGTSYQAEDGMTWGEWVDSSYNTVDGSVNSYNQQINIYGNCTVYDSSSYVYSYDVIVAGRSYGYVSAGEEISPI